MLADRATRANKRNHWFSEFQSAFAAHLEQNHEAAVTAWPGRKSWTKFASKACADSANSVFPSLKFASRGCRDALKCEYLSIDCTAHDETWAVPKLVIELENEPNEWNLRYSAWKLLCTRAERRLLIGYYKHDLHAAIDSILDVSRLHVDQELCVLLAQVKEAAKTAKQWRKHFSAHIMVGGES